MAYADYEFYINVYLGNVIAEEDYPRLSERASEYIYSVTKGLSDKVHGADFDRVKKATCAVAEIIFDETIMSASAFSGESAVSSESVGSWSRSYASPGLSQVQLEYLENRKREAILLYLGEIKAFASIFKVRSYRCAHK